MEKSSHPNLPSDDLRVKFDSDTSNGSTPYNGSTTHLPEEPDVEAEGETRREAPVYSVFSRSQKRCIVFMSGLGGFFSPLSANTYLPAIPDLKNDLGVSFTLIYLTITSFMIVQGIAPSIYGDLADMSGRRPAYLISFVLYVAANLGLALQNNYAALLVLRCLQSAGSSGMYSLNSGVVADISTTAERGKYMGAAQSGIMLGPAIGPILGGVLAQYLGWRSIFWFLMIFGAVYLVVFAIFVPETARKVVKDGSLPPIQLWSKSLLSSIAQRRHKATNPQEYEAKLQEAKDLSHKRPLRFPNPFTVLRIIVEKDIAILLLYNAIIYASWYTVTASISVEFSRNYDLGTLQVGLCYIPFGAGAALSILVNGRFQDYSYKRTARKHGFSVSKERGDDLTKFPIEKARLSGVTPLLFVGAGTIIGFGWALDYTAPLAVLLVLTFFMAFLLTAVYNSMNLLLVDMFPESPSTASAANNLTRCLLGAGGTAVIDPLIDGLGQGWAFTVVGGVLLLFSPILFVIIKYGQGWREERRIRTEAKAPH